ncbi:MAG: winged helix-turn-helix transcriptional regulator [Calditrichaeota bacterium]|nr:winged helix-turn-helix transcriptional regulator [Calditrichota bacterium]
MEARIKAQYEARAKILKALAHHTRLFILDQLSKEKHCVCELTEMIGADTSTVSKHLSVLRNAGLVKDEKVGASVYYELTTPCILNFFDCVETVIKTNAEQQMALTEN